jgi:hypothetical protein
MDNRRNGMHQIRVYIGSTISHGISESMADGPECRRREGPLVCPVRVNAKISVQRLSLQEVGEAKGVTSLLEKGRSQAKSWGCSVEKASNFWARRRRLSLGPPI